MVGTTYGVSTLVPTTSFPKFSDKSIYPHFSRTIGSNEGQIESLIETLLFYGDNQIGWDEVAVITSTTFNIGGAPEQFIVNAENNGLNVVSYQQFIPYQENFAIELNEVASSGARIIVIFIFPADYPQLITEAQERGLVNENYVWASTDTLLGDPAFLALDPDILQLGRGMLGFFDYIPLPSDNYAPYNDFALRYFNLDPVVYPGTGGFPSPFVLFLYDSVIVAARAIDYLDHFGNGILESGQTIPADVWDHAIRSIEYNATSGPMLFDKNGDRIQTFSVNYFDPDLPNWTYVGKWSDENGLEITNDMIWFSNTTEIPDLDIREPFNYWSCHDKKEKTDKTGKTVQIHTPDGSDVDDIDSIYHCDNFIDCKNLSDESTKCSSNYLIIFIVFGVITGILILIAFAILIFVIVFGVILKYQRLRVCSPTFLALILLSMIVGYSSIYAWFGKPHPVACGFQPWLLGLPTVSMIAALCVKVYRIWRIFGVENLQKLQIKDLQLFVLWVLIMLPAVLILVLWTIISTPTARMENRDGEDHYVCTTGGFTGEPGGYVFFAIFVAYTTLVLLFGGFLSIVTRKVPSSFNESKLLAISIYNLMLLGVVIIPVFLVVQPFNPFIAWILRTIAILYAFTATLVLQFAPSLIGILFVDKLQRVERRLNTFPIHTPNTSDSSDISRTKPSSSSNNSGAVA